jgi:membrane-associated phospholipid phosphatase
VSRGIPDILHAVLNSACAIALVLALQTTPQAPPASPPPQEDRPIQEIVQNLGRDLRRFISIDTGVIIGTGAVSAGATHRFDEPLANWAAAQGPSSYTSIGRILGNGWVQGGAAFGTYGIGLITNDKKTVHMGSDLIRAQVLNGLLTRSVKLVAGRERPDGGSQSMPSGHTSASFSSATVLFEHFGWKVGVPSFAVASFIGWTRVRDSQHWLTDVLVGASLGTAVGHAVSSGHRARSWTFVPVTGPDTAAIYLVRTR